VSQGADLSEFNWVHQSQSWAFCVRVIIICKSNKYSVNFRLVDIVVTSFVSSKLIRLTNPNPRQVIEESVVGGRWLSAFVWLRMN
jgi:hypothetical protein